MKKRIMAFLLALMIISIPAFADSGDALTDFGVKWLSLDSISNSENPVFSPASAYFALSMLAFGADGETLDEIRMLIGDENSANNLMNALTKERGDTKISIANSAWLDTRFELNPEYAARLAEDLSAEAFRLKLSSAEAVERLNSWINEKTEGMIPNTITEPFGEDTALALASTVYFNGKWMREFRGEATHKREFVLDNGETVVAEFMAATSSFGYCENADGSKSVIMRYTDGDTAMLAILPPTGVKASEYIKSMNAETVKGMLSAAEINKIELVIPKIEASGDYDLVQILSDLGIKSTFNMNTANLSGIPANPSVPVWVSNALHKARLSMSEKGTEAAAVTVFAIDAGAAPGYTPPPTVVFNRSFIYILMDLRTSSALFMGIVNDPSKFDLSAQKVSSGWKIKDGAPCAYIDTHKDGEYLESANYSLDDMRGFAVDACGAHPLECKEYTELACDKGLFMIEADVKPSKASVRYWNSDCIGNAEAREIGFETTESDELIFKIDTKERVVVELTLEWSGYTDLSGRSSYVFILNGGK